MRSTRKSFKTTTILFMISIVTVDCDKLSKVDDKVVLVAPVLAPLRASRAIATETAKEFPVLKLLAPDDSGVDDAVVIKNHQPVYVKKLAKQKGVARRRRRTTKIFFIKKY